jgi:hypothetical protein
VSESPTTVVEVSLDEESARARASAVREWLLAIDVARVNAKRDSLWQPSEFRAGPNVLRAATEWGPDEASRRVHGVGLAGSRSKNITFAFTPWA